MSAETATLIHLCADMLLAIVGVALALLVVWHDPWRRSNQYFALCMGIFTAFAVLNMVWAVIRLLDLQPNLVPRGLITLYVLGLMMVFNFVLRFAQLPHRLRMVERAISMPVAGLYVATIWLTDVYYDFQPDGFATYRYQVSLAGRVGLALILTYLVAMVVVLHRQRSPLARELTAPAAVLALGVISVSFVPEARRVALNTVALAVAAIMLGRLVLKVQVFQPLFDLNAELALKNAELIEASRLKSEFLANMSHELRTPLNSIIGYTDMVHDGAYGGLTALQEDRLEKVTRNGRLLLELINHVLDLSKIEAGRLELNCGPVETTALLDDLLHDYQPAAAAKGLSLVRGYDRLPTLYADELRVRQILASLISNAVKFTEQGVVIVRGHLDAERQQVVISVADSGPGIDPAEQEHLFDGFQQAGAVRAQGGTGLGLVVARRLAEIHGGNLWFESVVEHGSVFHVALPAASDSPPYTAVLRPRRQGSGPVVLAADANYETLKMVQDALEPVGCRVYGACSGKAALRLTRELRPALILLDAHLPDQSGWDVLRALRDDPTTARIAVIVLAAPDAERPPAPTHPDGTLSKPVRAASLLAEARRLLGDKALRREVAR